MPLRCEPTENNKARAHTHTNFNARTCVQIACDDGTNVYDDRAVHDMSEALRQVRQKEERGVMVKMVMEEQELWLLLLCINMAALALTT